MTTPPRVLSPPSSIHTADVSMASTVVPSQHGLASGMGSGGTRSSGSGEADTVRVLNISRQDSRSPQPRAAAGFTAGVAVASPLAVDSGSNAQASSALKFRAGADYHAHAPQMSSSSKTPPDAFYPPEPGGIPEELSESIAWTCADDSPWRKRARRGRMSAALGFEGRGGEEGGLDGSPQRAMKKRALEKMEVKASRKECKVKARERTAAPIMDLIGMTAPLFLIVGISMTQGSP